jgi:hypothetical protein
LRLPRKNELKDKKYVDCMHAQQILPAD